MLRTWKQRRVVKQDARLKMLTEIMQKIGQLIGFELKRNQGNTPLKHREWQEKNEADGKWTGKAP